MSIALHVLPAAALPTWGEVRRALGTEDVRLERVGRPNTPVGDGEALAGDTLYQLVADGYERPLTISLGVDPNADAPWSAQDLIDSYGDALDPSDRRRLALATERAGYVIRLGSATWRPEGELAVMGRVAAALADLTGGRVVVHEPAGYLNGPAIVTPAAMRAAAAAMLA